MKPYMLLLSLLGMLAPLAAQAQGTDNDWEQNWGARLSAGADWKISRGLHLSGEAEVRSRDNFSDIGRVQAGLNLSYKLNAYLKASVAYVFMENQNDASVWKMRHRVYGDLTATLRAGDWRFSLRERALLTHRDVGNKFQSTPNLFEIKSRLKASYKGFNALTPYAFVELRTVLNDPACEAKWDGSTYSSYQFAGYEDSYFNRYRAALGTQWKLDRHQALDLYFLLDYCYDKHIDTNKAGTVLKSLTYDRTLAPSFGIGYTFSF